MKKLITSKTFIAGTLAFLCVGILITCLLLNKDDKADFIPDPIPMDTPIDSWTENSAPIHGETDKNDFNLVNNPSNGQSDNVQENAYPAVIEEKEDEIIIVFTDPEATREPSPEAQGTNNDMPAQPPDHVGKPHDNPNSGKPEPGSTNEKGEVYDRVFGWIKPAEVIQEPIDNDGDPNKIIGSMK